MHFTINNSKVSPFTITKSNVCILRLLNSAPSCDHFGRHGEWKKYLATKILAKVTNWRPTDLKRNLLEKLSKILDAFNQ